MTKFSPSRRRFLKNSLSIAALAGISAYGYKKFTPKAPIVNVFRPGMDFGHMVRDYAAIPEPNSTWSCDLIILGSGASALTAAWKLTKENQSNFILLEGPEPNGNNAGIDNNELHYPTSAHYLALPSMESRHIREMLSDIGVLLGDPYIEKPEYDEMALIHAPEERLLNNGSWQESMLPKVDQDSKRFFSLVERLSIAKGEDNKKLFAIPIIQSSNDSNWRKLDSLTFEQWLTENNYKSESLRWYLNYCARDDYGQGIDKISAWAGLHYFCSRAGHAKNAENGSVITWQDGLASLSNKLRAYVDFKRSSIMQPNNKEKKPQIMSGSVLQATEHKDHVELLVGSMINGIFKTAKIFAKKVICAMPLYIASRVITDIETYGFAPHENMPTYAPWMVASFVLNQYPQEPKNTFLAWDNVVKEGDGLGYVVSTHQLIRAAKPERTAFTAYRPLDHDEPAIIRTWLIDAKEQDLVNLASSDLKLAYGSALWQHLEQIDITLRGHAMAVPTPGYLSNNGLQALQKNNSRILFAHADLSGYSVFEEAAWWGYQAALNCLPQ